ncbi:LAMI_0H12948g1_1 [Lachancea mirantina]|uniref:LAMI_0H12948g1_1 n=1 Tax=Lachancea mirantina TaxID=1230905 RepID=A0A1G4KHV6_9SACH|nr:LAMI_0H12948g1_1 [Lachancea mirantina]
MEQDEERRERHNQFVAELREQDRWLPINNVGRLMKNTLPVTAKVSKDAKECMQECVSEFISFVTSEANDRCAADKRKTINGEDILISLHALGFENYAEVLKIYLAKYRQQQALKNQMIYLRGEDEVPEGEESLPDEYEGTSEVNVETAETKHEYHPDAKDQQETVVDEEPASLEGQYSKSPEEDSDAQLFM